MMLLMIAVTHLLGVVGEPIVELTDGRCRGEFDNALDLAVAGAKQLFTEQRRALGW